MSKSQIKRIHEQQEAEKAIQKVEEEEEEAPVQRKGPANRFAFFDDEDSTGNQSDENTQKSEDEEDAPVEVEEKKTKKKAKKNKNKKGKPVEKEETDNQLLARLAAINVQEAKKAAATPDNQQNVEVLMKIDMKHFDMNAELKRKLGKAFKEALGNGDDSSENRVPPGFRPTGRIVKNKPTWFPANNCGLSMEKVKEEKGLTWFKLKHSNGYQQRERMFWLGESQMNIGVIHEIIQDSPYHLNSLLMMANGSRMNEEHNVAADLIERGIFFVDQYSNSSFEPFNWCHRMDYTDYENRVFYLLLHRHMLNAANKRCWETAFNTSKLVFKLDPVRDPLAVMSIIDVYALRCKQYNWIVQMFEGTKKFKKLDLLPNWPYSVALAKFFLGRTEEAEVELRTAIRHFPSVVVQLMDILQIHPDSAVMNCKMLTSFVADNERESLKLLMKIYTKSTEEIWKQPEVLLFLEQATRYVATSTDQMEKKECEEWKEKRSKMYQGRSPNVDRLAELLDIIPTTSISDPVPPKNGRNQYPRVENIPEPSYADQGFIAGLIHSLMPEFDPSQNIMEQMLEARRRMVASLDDNAQVLAQRYDEIMRWVDRAMRLVPPPGEDDDEDEMPVVNRLDDGLIELPEEEEEDDNQPEERRE